MMKNFEKQQPCKILSVQEKDNSALKARQCVSSISYPKKRVYLYGFSIYCKRLNSFRVRVCFVTFCYTHIAPTEQIRFLKIQVRPFYLLIFR